MLSALIDLFYPRQKVAIQLVEMSEDDKAIIEAYAKGDETLRDKAIEIHRLNIDTIGVRGNVYQRFMAEVDNSAPDYNLRNGYREQIIRLTA